MNLRKCLVLIMFLPALIFINCSSDSNDPAVTESYDYYVDAVKGSNSNTGTSADKAFKTITYAVNHSAVNVKIKVQPGLYNTANGETFPITLLSGQQLIGDTANKGDGTTATEIQGYASYTSDYTAVIPADNSTIKGFKISCPSFQIGFYGIYIGDVSASVTYNTFPATNTYGGIMIYNTGSTRILNIANNIFRADSYGIRIESNKTVSLIIEYNNFESSVCYPIDAAITTSATVINNNNFTSSGITAIMVENGSPVIRSNSFNSPGYFSSGAILCQYAASPKIRGNYFKCSFGIETGPSNTGDPDIGTSTDSGNNDFSNVTGYAVKKSNDTTVLYAIGNTWKNTTPVLGSDIYIDYAGDKVYYTASAYLTK